MSGVVFWLVFLCGVATGLLIAYVALLAVDRVFKA